MDAAMNELNAAWQTASNEMYNAANAQQPQDGAGQPGGSTNNQEQVTVVNFEEVK